MIVYLDNSFLNRPFDDPEVGTNKLESEVLSLILELVKAGKADMVNSSVIEYENSLNPITERKTFVKEILKGSKVYQNVEDKTKKRAHFLTQEMMLSPIDALHLATAEQAKADIFITCDYGIIKKYKGEVKTINPLEFLKYYENSIK
ncbi:type II toxin-antitoxin system VapC family toxin [Candidatus Daviesbacteria bacterium]|nr:type II toxin-antitoxin system VapC family toxin [Candidatus Daviesbacteria bacterium]